MYQKKDMRKCEHCEKRFSSIPALVQQQQQQRLEVEKQVEGNVALVGRDHRSITQITDYLTHFISQIKGKQESDRCMVNMALAALKSLDHEFESERAIGDRSKF
eukprot:767186-Hanusia_phi.AAC.2